MYSTTAKETVAGFTLASIAFILVTSSLPLTTAHAAVANPLFSMTFYAPTGNPTRRLYAGIIANSFQQVGIDANVVYVGSTGHEVSLISVANGPLYSQGGYDAYFIGFVEPLVPDWSTSTSYDSANPSFLPPIGQNWDWFQNATVNKILTNYSTNFNPVARNQLTLKLVTAVMQQRPDLAIVQQADIFALKSYLYPYGTQTGYSSIQAPDFEHWKITQGSTVNVAISSAMQNIDPLPVSTSNDVYDGYVYGALIGTSVQPGGGAAQTVDPRTFTFYNAIASSITHSADARNWNITLRPNVTFSDSASVTANDFVFTEEAGLREDAAYVGLGSLQTYFGLNAQFTYLNGTSRYIKNGTVYNTKPANWAYTNSTFTAVSPTLFSFHMQTPYAFTNPGLTGIAPLPMHVLEKIPASQWATSWFSTLQNTPTTITWNKAVYGGNGSYAYAYGPIGDGPYVYKGYNSVSETATLVKNPTYWNRTGLESLGQFGVQTVHIVHIDGKDAALAAFGNGQVNFLDSFYSLNTPDLTTVANDGGYAKATTTPSNLLQFMGLNWHSPVWGTGTATPLGQATPSKAAYAAQMVRKAMSYLIPRSYIISNFYPAGAASPAITQISTAFASYYPKGAAPDPYDPTAAKSFLAAAGYSTGVPAPSGSVITLPQLPPVTVNGTNVAVPNFVSGSSVTLAGAFRVSVAQGQQANGYAVVLQQSTDGGKTWQNLLFTQTNSGGYYTLSYTPQVVGSVQYRVFFTGVAWNDVQASGINDPNYLVAQVPPLLTAHPLNITSTQTGPVSSLQIGSLGDVVKVVASGSQLQSLATSLNNALSQLQANTQNALQQLQSSSASNASVNTVSTNISTLTSQVNTLSGQVSTLTTVSYAALGIAIVLGLVAIGLSRRKP